MQNISPLKKRTNPARLRGTKSLKKWATEMWYFQTKSQTYATSEFFVILRRLGTHFMFRLLVLLEQWRTCCQTVNARQREAPRRLSQSCFFWRRKGPVATREGTRASATESPQQKAAHVSINDELPWARDSTTTTKKTLTQSKTVCWSCHARAQRGRNNILKVHNTRREIVFQTER